MTRFVTDWSRDDWPSVLSRNLGASIAAAREAKGMSAVKLSEAAAALGVSVHRVAIPRIEKGEQVVTVPELVALGMALEADWAEWLITATATAGGVGFAAHVGGDGEWGMTDYYDRDGKSMPDDWYDTKKHGQKYRGSESRVARTVLGDIIVSTVWLGLDHQHFAGPPVIFETMTFGEPWNNEMERYSTEEDAMRGHLRVLERLRSGRPPFAYLDGGDDDE